ncbi:TIGR03987 family protein [Brevibacillus fluminis]|uniref:TIGR03987 family protein n=1 Tax=Brevibacillus fluminis TaxID=511487 RepID=A0A3M8CX12_9BACL|nr:HsmA family protein [Brevibacillus fluminis]RNB80168.1 TIGR03987 family protein [Brevibacillus fluminis]
MLAIAVICINLALIAYSIGVWSEKRSGQLKAKHLVYFAFGLLFDTVGTTFMKMLAEGPGLNLHGITGLVALLLMFFHTVWACFVLFKKQEKQIKQFHKFSLFVWCVWLIPYFIGVALSFIK